MPSRYRERDYAVFEVNPVPRATVAVDFHGRAPVGTTTTLFGHPDARPLEWSKTCSVQPGIDATYPEPSMLAHACDTEPGSSGSAILSDASLEVIGIHDGGGSWNYGTFIVDTPLAEIMGVARPARPASSHHGH